MAGNTTALPTQKVDPAHQPRPTSNPMQQMNPNHPMQQMNPNHPMQQMNPNYPMQQMNPNHPMQLTNLNHPMEQMNPNHPMQQMNPNHPMHNPMRGMESGPTMLPMKKVESLMHHQLMRNDRHMLSSDDSVMIRQIQGSHAPDGREVDVKPLLHIVEDILSHASPNFGGHGTLSTTTPAHMDALDDKTHQAGFIGMLEALAYTIHKISCEMSCKCLSGGDAHSTTVSLFSVLSSYSWDAKVVLVLAAFSVNYGEFWLLAQLYPTNHLAKSIALLKQQPEALDRSESHRPRFEALNNLIKAIIDVTKCIVELTELPPQYITPDVSAMSMATAHVPTAAYWTIRGIVACASQITALVGLGHEHISSTTEAWELSSLAHKVNHIHDHLTKQLSLCYQYIDGKRQQEAYSILEHILETSHIDNTKILRAFFYSKDDLPLVDGYGKKRVSIDVLRRKSVLLLISDLTISHEELSILDQLYRESHNMHNGFENQYEVVWFPVVDRSTPWSEVMQKQFESMYQNMPWYTLYQPTETDPAVIRYIKEYWKFVKKPILVVLDPHGSVANKNAIHMMWIWGVTAFPFTREREEALWKEEIWRLELLVDGIDVTLLNWIHDGRYICLYGGEDIGWIRKFTSTVQAVARSANITLEMVYVGKSNPRERVRRNNDTIAAEKLSHHWPDLTSMWFFWVRLESMMYSKMQLGKSPKNDTIMHEIMKMVGYDSGHQGWALFTRGSAGVPELSRGTGEMMLTSFTQFDEWKKDVEPKGFIPALNGHLEHIHTPHHCTHLKLPGTVGSIMETVVCAECGRLMEKFYMYECCTD